MQRYAKIQNGKSLEYKNFPILYSKHILINQINFGNIIIYLYISVLNIISVSCKETDIIFKEEDKATSEKP